LGGRKTLQKRIPERKRAIFQTRAQVAFLMWYAKVSGKKQAQKEHVKEIGGGSGKHLRVVLGKSVKKNEGATYLHSKRSIQPSTQ